MSKVNRILKWSALTLTLVVLSAVLFGFWFMSLLPTPTKSVAQVEKTTPGDLPYLSEHPIAARGKILAVVTSTDTMGTSGKPTGYELTELSRAYYVFQANGFEVDVASPQGGNPPVVIDDDDMREYDFAFLNDTIAQQKVAHTIAMKDVVADDYKAIYFVGGKGAMFDFPDNEYIQSIVRDYYLSGKVVGAVCHGPAALINVRLNNGDYLVSNKSVSGFTNEEELLLIPDAEEIFPFLLQDKLTESGARFNEGFMYLNKVTTDGNLVTGQNPWSTWEVAETIIARLGYEPKARVITSEENTIDILVALEAKGYESAKLSIDQYCTDNPMTVERELLAVHSIVAAMQFDLWKAAKLIRLLSYSNRYL